MRRIALINQKGGVGKTTVTVNLGAALARAGQSVVLVDLDPQANLTLYLGLELASGEPSTYRVLTGEASFGAALRSTATPNLRVLPTDIHLTGAELELANTEGRELLLRDALATWCEEHARSGAPGAVREPADYVLFDCPPSLGLLSLNALAAADEVFLVVQTQFLALQGTSRLVEVIELVKRRLHPELALTGIVPCMYDSRMRLAREVLSELRHYFPTQVFRTPISANVKLAEAPSFAKTIFEYAPESIGARDFASLAHEVLTQAALARTRVAAPPQSAGRKRGALEAFASSTAALAPPQELGPVLPPRPRKRRSAAPSAAQVPSSAGGAEAPPASGSAPRASAKPAPTAHAPLGASAEHVAAALPAVAPRRARPRPAD